MPRTVEVTRYVTPLREGGSLPAIVEAEDLGTYVLKFRGAGQGPKVLVAELVVGELARRLGFRVPEIVFARLDTELARSEPDPEIQDLIRASGGRNLALDYLPGSFGFDPLATPPDPTLASRLLWFDAFTANVDRSIQNTNLLLWHGEPWLIDHGAALYFHHNWPEPGEARERSAARPYPAAERHVMLPFATGLRTADAELAARVTPTLLREVVEPVPDEWLAGEAGFDAPDAVREAYLLYLTRRLEQRACWVTALEEAHERRAV